MAKLKPITLTSQNIVQVVSEQTGLPEDIVRRIILLMNFALFRKDGKLTKFAREFKITGYEDLYNFLKGLKQDYRNDREVQAFTIKYNTLCKSAVLRAGAWIFNTFVKYEDGDENEKRIRANLFAISFVNRTFGHMMENLKLFQKIVKAMDRAKKEVAKFVEGEQYTKQESELDAMSQ